MLPEVRKYGTGIVNGSFYNIFSMEIVAIKNPLRRGD